MEGDDRPLDDLKRDFQQLKSQLLELSARVGCLESRIISLNEMIEERDQH